MARGGINKAVVEKARNALIAQGRNPSIDAIRIELGNTGSKSTIHRYLKELEQAEGTLAEGMLSISEELTALVTTLAQRLHDEAQGRIDVAQEGFDEHRARLQAQLNETASRADALQQSLAGTQEALSQALQRHEALQATHQAEQTRNARLAQANEDLQARLADKQAQVLSIEEQLRQARDTIEQHRALSDEQRAQVQRRHDAQLEQLQAQVQQAQHALAGRQEALTQLERDNERLMSALGQSEQQRLQAVEHGAHLQREVARLATLQGEAQGAREVLANQLADTRQALEKARESAAQHGRELAEARVRGELLEQALAEAKAAFRPPVIDAPELA